MPRKQRQQVTAEVFFEGYIRALTRDRAARSRWQSSAKWSDKKWTSIAMRAVAAAIRSASRKKALKVDVAMRGRPDVYGQSEYFAIDAIGHLKDWNHPVIVVEHENRAGEEVQYALWKLLSVHADLRILICYIDSRRRYRKYAASANELIRGKGRGYPYALLEVLQGYHGNRDVALIVGDWQGDPSLSRGWKEVYSLYPHIKL